MSWYKILLQVLAAVTADAIYMLYLFIYLLPLQKGNKGQATKEKTYQTERN